VVKKIFSDARASYSGRTFEAITEIQEKLLSQPVVESLEVSGTPEAHEDDSDLVEPQVSEVLDDSLADEETSHDVENSMVEEDLHSGEEEDEPLGEVTIEPNHQEVEESEHVIDDVLETVESPTVEEKPSPRASSTLKKGGYRETSAEERERRARRFFKIDEDSPFSLES
jgi:hypothetical protein